MSSDEGDTDFEDRSAYNAVFELHNGRIEWLTEHIRRSNFQIHETVARKILAMIERTDQNCDFEITLKRRTGLPPAHMNAHARAVRDLDLALAVGRKCRFKRGHVQRACAEVAKEMSEGGDRPGLKADYIEKCARRYKAIALDIIAEEEAQAAYERR
jgi:hypothetical protein